MENYTNNRLRNSKEIDAINKEAEGLNLTTTEVLIITFRILKDISKSLAAIADSILRIKK